MKIIVKLFGMFLLLNILTLSSCKKELGCTDINAVNYDPDAEKDDGSCVDIILGCIDNNMLNYNPLANTDDGSCCDVAGCTDETAFNYDPNPDICFDDGSCLFFYDIAQGEWDIEPDCDDITIPILNFTISLNDQLPESIEVQGAGGNALFIDIDGTQVSGDIDNYGNITVTQQTVPIDPVGTGTPIDVTIEGNGQIESDVLGEMDLNYSFSFQGFPLSTSCSIVLSR